MTDFVDDLERELLAAARRRTARERRLPRALRPKLDGRALGLVAVAAIATAIAFVVRPTPDSEHAATPQRRVLHTVALPTLCAGTRDLARTPAPKTVFDTLAVLRRKPGKADGLPGGLMDWLPVGSYAPGSARRAGDNVLVLPTSDVRDRSPRCGDSSSRGPGACVVTEVPVAAACFTLDEIRSARAFAVENQSVVGLVPDGWHGIELDIAGTRLRLPAGGNVVRDELSLNGPVPFTATPVTAPLRILLLNETRVDGLAAATREELTAELGLDVKIDIARSSRRSRRVTTIDRTRDTTLAQRVAYALGTGYGISSDTPPKAPGAPDVIVHLGTDRMR